MKVTQQVLMVALTALFLLAAVGCKAPPDIGSEKLVMGSFLSDVQILRVADLMARDMVRDPVFYRQESPPRVALIKVENNTNQYLFGEAKSAYLISMRTNLKQALKERIKLIDLEVEKILRDELKKWHLDEVTTAGLAQGKRNKHGVDYFLTATFDSLDKVVLLPKKGGGERDRHIVELQMTFSLVDAETAELAWQNTVSSAAAFTSRDFQN